MPGSIESDIFGVWIMLSFMRKMFSPEPSATEPLVFSMIASA